jgi:hypothetical protein
MAKKKTPPPPLPPPPPPLSDYAKEADGKGWARKLEPADIAAAQAIHDAYEQGKAAAAEEVVEIRKKTKGQIPITILEKRFSKLGNLLKKRGSKKTITIKK